LGQPVSDHPSSSARQKLFKDYMDHVCTIQDENDQSVQFKLEVADFLAGGADSGGEGDYQGCGEFNPVLVFSQQENQDFSDPQRKDKRDAENAPNRRVLIFLFRPGVHISPKSWPCPRVKEGVDGCKKRFWSDGEKRRKFQEERREFKDTQHTFACRFYDRISANSPCERILEQFRIRLFDPTGRPLPGAPFRIQVAGRSIPGQANRDGDAMVQHLTVPATCNVFWSRPDDEAPPPKEPTDFQFFKVIHVLIEDLDKNEKTEAAGGTDHPDDASVKRLQNLGYTRHPDLAENVRDFQEDLGLSGDKLTGKIADVQDELRNRHDSLNPPRRTPRTGA